MSLVFLITGASRGLGLAMAQKLAPAGHRLVLVARHADNLEQAAAPLRPLTEVLTIAADVGQQAEEIVARSLTRFGRIDVLINNASSLGPSPMPGSPGGGGGMPGSPGGGGGMPGLADYPWQELAQVLHTNVLAPLHLTQLALPSMRERGRGLIVNISSDAGIEAYPGWGGYGMSKAALEHQSRTWAAELDGSGIRVLLVDPGDMNTRMHQEAEPGVDLSHLPEPSVVAERLLPLLSLDGAPFARVRVPELVGAR